MVARFRVYDNDTGYGMPISGSRLGHDGYLFGLGEA
jgi:hypothetical protein